VSIPVSFSSSSIFWRPKIHPPDTSVNDKLVNNHFRETRTLFCAIFFPNEVSQNSLKKKSLLAARSLVKFDNRNELKSDFYFRSAFSETTKELEKKTWWKLLQCLYHCLKPRKKEKKTFFFSPKNF
jgi:hypothetical protein